MRAAVLFSRFQKWHNHDTQGFDEKEERRERKKVYNFFDIYRMARTWLGVCEVWVCGWVYECKYTKSCRSKWFFSPWVCVCFLRVFVAKDFWVLLIYGNAIQSRRLEEFAKVRCVAHYENYKSWREWLGSWRQDFVFGERLNGSRKRRCRDHWDGSVAKLINSTWPTKLWALKTLIRGGWSWKAWGKFFHSSCFKEEMSGRLQSSTTRF